MAQHDQVIDNGSGLAVRTDFNSAIAALFSNSSGPVEPSVTVAGQFWWDTANASNPVLRQRNLANTGWMTISQGGQSAIDIAAGKRAGPPKDTFVWNDKIDLSGTDVMTLDDTGNLSMNGNLALPNATTITAPNAVLTAKGASFTGDVAVSGAISALHGIPDYISGLTMVNNATTPNTTVDILPGECKGNGKVVFSAATMSKRLDAAWAVGNAAGGLDTGTKAVSKTYFIWAIRKQSDGTFDWLYSLSVTAPAVPASYDAVKVLCPIMTDASGNIIQQIQRGNTFTYKTQIAQFSTSTPQATALVGWAVPVGIVVKPILTMSNASNAQSGLYQYLADAASGGASPILVFQLVYNASTASANTTGMIPPIYSTNTNAQMYWSFSIGAGSGTASVNTCGFVWDGSGRI